VGFNYCEIADVKQYLLGLDVSDMPSSLDLLIEKTWIPWAKREVDGFLGKNLDLTTINEFYDGSGTNEIVLRHRPISFLRNAVLRIIPQIEWFQFRRWFHLNTVDSTGVEVTQRGGVEPIDSVVEPIYTFINTDPVPNDLKTTDTGSVTASFINTTEQYEKSDLYVDCRLGTLIIPPRILFLESQGVPFWNYTFLRGKANIELEYDYGYKDLESLPVEFRNACAKLVAANVLQAKGIFSGSGALSLNVGGVGKPVGDIPYGPLITTYAESSRQSLLPYKSITVG